MKELSESEYLAMRAGAQVEASDQHGDKVLLLADGSYLKLFRVKRLITSAWLFPYWKRFVSNAAGLAGMGVPTLRVQEVFELPHLNRTVVHYDPLPGKTLRQVDLDADLVGRFGRFLSGLHDKGVYLRSLHLGNVILTPDGELGLIDFADMRLYARSLGRNRRFRNFQHLCRYEKDRQRIAEHLEQFVSSFDERYRAKLTKMFAT